MKTTTTKNQTHIAKVRAKHQTQKERVCEILNWTEERYADHQFEVYLKVLNKLHIDCPKIEQRLAYSPVFRGFFNSEWERRNREEFLSIVEVQDGGLCINANGAIDFLEERQETDDYNYQEYIFIHSADRLCQDHDFLTAHEYIMDLVF